MKERSSKSSITMHGTESRSNIPLQPGDRVHVDPRRKQARYSQGPAVGSATLLRSRDFRQPLTEKQVSLLPFFQQPMSTEKNKPDDIGNREEQARRYRQPGKETSFPEPERLEQSELESPEDRKIALYAPDPPNLGRTPKTLFTSKVG